MDCRLRVSRGRESFRRRQKLTKPPAEKPQVQLSAEIADSDPFAESPAAKPVANKPPAKKSLGKKQPKMVAKESAPHKAAAQEMSPGGNVAAIEKALASTTQLDFVEAPLQDVIDYLKNQHNIEIQIDKRPLEDVSVTTDTPVTINIKGITLRSALNLMLRNMQPELTYTIKDEVLLITTPEVADENLFVKVYEVARSGRVPR